MSKKLTQEEFLKRAIKTHGDRYDYSDTKYIGRHKKIIIKCKTHGQFEQTAGDHLSGRGCSKCMGFDKSTEEFIKEANTIHGDKYDYLLTNYIGSNKKITIICPMHGQFEQTPSNHLTGKGCPKCNGKNKTTVEFKKQASGIHNNFYDYSLTNYIESNKKITIICPTHGQFEQTPHSHLNGRGCPTCVGKNKTTVEFKKQAGEIHNDFYNYSLVEYVNAISKIKIICPTHGVFMQKPCKHLSGTGCPKCSHGISKPEILWLDSLNIPEEYRQQKILKYKVDGYDPETNTVYEFHGDFWHGNPNKFNPDDINPKTKTTYRHLYEKTLEKEQTIIANGYNLVSIWESDFI
jgi:hypothetical protein